MSMIRDANTAKRAAEIEILLQDCERIIAFYSNLAEQGGVRGNMARSMVWDLGSVRARFDCIRELIVRPTEKNGGEEICIKS